MFFQHKSSRYSIFFESSTFLRLQALFLLNKTTDQVPSVLSRNLFWDNKKNTT